MQQYVGEMYFLLVTGDVEDATFEDPTRGRGFRDSVGTEKSCRYSYRAIRRWNCPPNVLKKATIWASTKVRVGF